MKLGQLVMLVGTDGYMPPLGSIGEIVGLVDEDDDYTVEFYNYPCPVGESYWYAHKSWLIPLYLEKQNKTAEIYVSN